MFAVSRQILAWLEYVIVIRKFVHVALSISTVHPTLAIVVWAKMAIASVSEPHMASEILGALLRSLGGEMLFVRRRGGFGGWVALLPRVVVFCEEGANELLRLTNMSLPNSDPMDIMP